MSVLASIRKALCILGQIGQIVFLILSIAFHVPFIWYQIRDIQNINYDQFQSGTTNSSVSDTFSRTNGTSSESDRPHLSVTNYNIDAKNVFHLVPKFRFVYHKTSENSNFKNSSGPSTVSEPATDPSFSELSVISPSSNATNGGGGGSEGGVERMFGGMWSFCSNRGSDNWLCLSIDEEIA